MKQFEFSVTEKQYERLRLQIPFWLPLGEAAKQLLLSWSMTNRGPVRFDAEKFRQVALGKVCRPQEKAAVIALSLIADERGRVARSSAQLSALMGWGRRNCEKAISRLCKAGVARREERKLVLIVGGSQ